MPFTYAHALNGLSAQKLLEEPAAAITKAHRDAFLLGMYGPDVYFGDRIPKPLFKKNMKAVGNRIHSMDGRELFTRLFQLSYPDDRAFSYVLGLICHFSLDWTMHPYIEARARGNDHTRLEMHQDLHVREHVGDPEAMLPPNALYDTDGAVRVADTLMTSLIFGLTGGSTAGAYKRSYRKWRNLQTLAYDPKGRKRAFVAGIEKLFHMKKGKLSGFLMTQDPQDGDLMNLNHKKWRAPWQRDRVRTESYYELYDQATALSAELINCACRERARGGTAFEETLDRIGHRSMDGTGAV